MNLGIRCGQMMVERFSEMNIVERSAWHSRCARFDEIEVVPTEYDNKASPQVVVHRYSDMSKEEYDLLQQTSRKVDYLERKLNDYFKEQFKKRLASKYT